ncbi:MAG TPA: sugar ABC transporter permease [Chthonomonadaceae bacterium]|nr:sugar ABC transporter permease [Chthonomonadaceae bacterium]
MVVPSPAKAKRRAAGWTGWLFVLPSFAHLAVFVLFPILFAFYLSLHKWDVLKHNKPFVGLANYVHLLHDPLFWNALWNSTYYAVVSVPLGMAVALAVAILVHQRLRGVAFFRTLYYLPAVSSAVALSMVWTFIYLPEHGLISWTLNALGLHDWAQIDWLQSTVWAMPALIFMSIWTGLGPRMVLFLAGLAGIPEALYEAAAVDGAGRWAAFRHITLPMLLPTTFFILITSSISAFQVFTPIYMMTQGGPVRHTDVVGYHIYNQAWRQFHMGMASAQSYVLFLVILAVTIVQFKVVSKRMEEFSLH